MSLKLDNEAEREVQLEDRFGHPLKEGTPVLVRAARAHYNANRAGLLTGEIKKIFKKQIEVSTERYSRFINFTDIEREVVNITKLKEL